eukprot:GHRR01010315.1.p1 GENE.GHRR01010315.1~~GHRR01010315.1.p1  ORF type:complete len:548 (+),score=138.18 GHRR01010315.1:757-2400(+)
MVGRQLPTLTCLVAAALFCQCTAARSLPESSLWHFIHSASFTVRRDPAKHWQQGWAVWDAHSNIFTISSEFTQNSGAPAYANYSHASNHPSGFGQLRVKTDASYSNEVQMAAAGFVEGYLTAPQIFDHWYNWRWWLSQQANDTYKIGNWLMAQHAWLTKQAEDPSNKVHPFWQAQRLVLAQLHGMRDGYNARVMQEGQQLGIDFISLFEWLTLNTMGDMDDLLEVLFPDDPRLGLKHLHKLDPHELHTRLATRGHCSVLIKVIPDLSDLLIGHTTWWTYTGMTRIYKHYSFALQGQQYKARTSSLSSYPGMITSMDDFYILDSHLVVTETSNSVFDESLWAQVTPEAALSWQRVLAANWLSSSGEEWAYWIKQHNSGTYNNQYMVVDLNRFTPGQELQEGLLTVVEQIPGLVVSADKTQTLERGYWPSYNVPYFPEIYNQSGYPDFINRLKASNAEAYKSMLSGVSYQLAPRAKISRRDQGTVADLDGLKAYMRSNRWSSEPYSDNSPFGAICGRGDLDPKSAKASGCTDAKVQAVARLNICSVFLI